MCKHHTQPTMSIFVKSETHHHHYIEHTSWAWWVTATLCWLPTMYSTLYSDWDPYHVLCITLILLYLVSEGANSFGNARWSSHFTVIKLGKGRGWSAGARDVEGGSLLCYALHTALFSSRLCLTLGRRGGLRGCLWSSTLASFFKVLSHSFISYLVLVHNLP